MSPKRATGSRRSSTSTATSKATSSQKSTSSSINKASRPVTHALQSQASKSSTTTLPAAQSDKSNPSTWTEPDWQAWLHSNPWPSFNETWTDEQVIRIKQFDAALDVERAWRYSTCRPDGRYGTQCPVPSMNMRPFRRDGDDIGLMDHMQMGRSVMVAMRKGVISKGELRVDLGAMGIEEGLLEGSLVSPSKGEGNSSRSR